MNSELERRPLIWRVATTSVLIFACYFIIGLQLAVVPTFVHWRLGYSPVVAGLAVSFQYVATLLSRPAAGRMADTRGGKFTTCSGLLICAASGLVFFVSAGLNEHPLASLCMLLLCRLILGVGESCVATGGTLWGIGRVGADHTASVISWSGIASYGGLAIGAPVGVALENGLGSALIGVASIGVVLAGFFWSLGIKPIPVLPGKKLSFWRVFATVFPYGLNLALGGVAFGTIASFIALYYGSRQWPHGAFALSLFGISFIAARLMFSNTINRWGGYRVAMVSLSLECLGLLLLWVAPISSLASVGAAVTGFGFSLVFPALGVEAVRKFLPQHRGAALGVYTAFVDLSLGISGPMAGIIVVGLGYPPIFLFAAVLSASSSLLSYRLYRNHSGRIAGSL